MAKFALVREHIPAQQCSVPPYISPFWSCLLSLKVSWSRHTVSVLDRLSGSLVSVQVSRLCQVYKMLVNHIR